MKETLEELIKNTIRTIDEGNVPTDRIESFTDYKAKYVILRPSVKVEIALTDGKLAKIDVSDYFGKEIH